eukprot:9374236-Alexandrium_andersonii.AAC.1
MSSTVAQGGDERDSDADDDAGGEGFVPASITAVWANKTFYAYVHMVLLLTGVLQDLSAWAERCPCHDAVQA